jgi:hypothetical protein
MSFTSVFMQNLCSSGDQIRLQTPIKDAKKVYDTNTYSVTINSQCYNQCPNGVIGGPHRPNFRNRNFGTAWRQLKQLGKK